MKARLFKQALAAVALAATLLAPAHANVITFDSLTPGSLFLAGDSFSEAGYTLTVAGGGFGLVDNAAAFGSSPLAPGGNATQFFSSFNDSALVLEAVGNRQFTVSSFDYGFISPIAGSFGAGDVPGLMLALYEAFDGTTDLTYWAFGPSDSAGNFAFQGVGPGDVGALGGWLRSVTFAACTFDANGDCSFTQRNQSQFALDNIQLNLVPEPGSWTLAVLALAAAASLRRRSRASLAPSCATAV